MKSIFFQFAAFPLAFSGGAPKKKLSRVACLVCAAQSKPAFFSALTRPAGFCRRLGWALFKSVFTLVSCVSSLALSAMQEREARFFFLPLFACVAACVSDAEGVCSLLRHGLRCALPAFSCVFFCVCRAVVLACGMLLVCGLCVELPVLPWPAHGFPSLFFCW